LNERLPRFPFLWFSRRLRKLHRNLERGGRALAGDLLERKCCVRAIHCIESLPDIAETDTACRPIRSSVETHAVIDDRDA